MEKSSNIYYKEIKIDISGNGFSPMGAPFALQTPDFSDATIKKLKKEFNELEGLLSYDASNSPEDIKGIFSLNGGNISLTLDVFNGKPKTFKFMGMDITEDFDAVIKGSHGVVRVGTLFHFPLLRDFISKKFSDSDIGTAEIDKIIGGLSLDALKGVVERIKFSTDVVDINTIFKDLSSAVVQRNEQGFRSVILNIVNKNIGSSADLKSIDLLNVLKTALTRYWMALIGRYEKLSSLLSYLDKFFQMHTKLYGIDKTREIIKSSITSGEYGDFGTFHGFGENIGATRTQCSIVDYTLAEWLSGSSGEGISEFTNAFGGTMFELSPNMDISEMSSKDFTALSVLDGLKYVDKDLELDVRMYDLNSVEDREFLFKNAITSYKKRFDTMFDVGVNIDNEFINNVMDENESFVDILTTKDDYSEELADVEVSKVSFNKTNLMSVSKLVGRLLNSIHKSFKS